MRSSTVSSTVSPLVESLESRTLFAAAHLISIQSDNRGEVMITFDKALDPATVKTTSVQEFIPGPDGLPGTADDQRITARVKLTVACTALRVLVIDLEGCLLAQDLEPLRCATTPPRRVCAGAGAQGRPERQCEPRSASRP